MQLYHYIPDSWAWTKSSAKSDVSYHEDLSFSSDGKGKYALLVLFFILYSLLFCIKVYIC